MATTDSEGFTQGDLEAEIETDREAREAKHEAHGYCRVCFGGVHAYPFGVSHVTGTIDSHEPRVRWTCCAMHGKGQA